MAYKMPVHRNLKRKNDPLQSPPTDSSLRSNKIIEKPLRCTLTDSSLRSKKTIEKRLRCT